MILFTGSETDGLIKKIDALEESIEQASKILGKGQQNLDTIECMYSKNFK